MLDFLEEGNCTNELFVPNINISPARHIELLVLIADPHFHTWDNQFYDFHGECDLILIKNDVEGIHLHIRTEPQGGYASISHAVLKLGGETLEITKMGTEPPSLPADIGGYALSLTSTTSSYGSTEEYQVDIAPPGQFVRITRYQYVSSPAIGLDIIVQANGANFLGSEGLCGSWNSGGVQDRNGNPFPSPTNTNDYAQEWQVLNPAENLFFDGGSATCTNSSTCSRDFPLPPDADEGGSFPCKGGEEPGENRDLVDDNGRNLKGHAAAGLVNDNDRNLQRADNSCPRTCNDIDATLFPEHKLNCVFDVIVTGDNNFACTPAYIDPKVIRQDTCPPQSDSCVTEDTKCEKKGGRCVSECTKSKEWKCIPSLCHEKFDKFNRPGPKEKQCICKIPKK